MMSAVFKKTELGQSEIHTKLNSLGMRERRALILMDGLRPLSEVETLLGASVYGIAQRLLDLGLVRQRAASKGAQAFTPSAMEFTDTLTGHTPASNFESFDKYLPTHSDVWNGEASQKSTAAVVTNPVAKVPSTDAQGLASAPGVALQTMSPRGVLLGKMYLLDLVERLLGKDDGLYRAKIQQVRSQEQLLAVSDEVMEGLNGLVSPAMFISIYERFMQATGKK